MRNPTQLTASQLLDQLDGILQSNTREQRLRLATYIRRYVSPLLSLDLYANGELDMLISTMQLERATILIADVRGFTPQTLVYEQRQRGLDDIAEMLRNFLIHASETAFAHRALVGEFSGDRLMSLFGLLADDQYEADRAVLTAIFMYANAQMINQALLLEHKHHLAFDIGIGICSGGPIWLGDLSSDWRRELTVIGTAVNVAARIEEMTKVDEFRLAGGYNIVLAEQTVNLLSPQLRECLELKSFEPRRLRGLGETLYAIYKIVDVKWDQLPTRSEYIDPGMRSFLKILAQRIESYQERRNIADLGVTMFSVAQRIAASFDEERISNSVLDAIQEILFAETASILFLNNDSLKFIAVRPSENINALRSIESGLMSDVTIVGYVARSGSSLCLADARSAERFRSNATQESGFNTADQKTGFYTRSVLCVPLRIDGVVAGVIQVIDRQENKYGKDDLRTLETIAAIAATAISNARLYRENADAEVIESMSQITASLAHSLKDEASLLKYKAGEVLKRLDRPSSKSTRQELKKQIQTIEQISEHLLEKTNQISSPLQPVGLTSICLPEILNSVILTLQTAGALDGTVKLDKSYCADVPDVVSDARRLHEVFLSIIKNAIEAMRGQEVCLLRIQVEFVPPDRVVVKIIDNGPGIPQSIRDLLFGRSVAALSNRNGNRKHYAWGYALFIARRSMRVLGGDVSFATDFSPGTCAVVSVPVYPLVPEQLRGSPQEDEAYIAELDQGS